jgi:hypothetical protein
MLSNHHMAKPVMIGEIKADGQFAIVYQSKPLPPKAWSPYVEANKGKSRIGPIRGSAGAARLQNIIDAAIRRGRARIETHNGGS